MADTQSNLKTMSRRRALLGGGAALTGAAALASPALSQGTPQTIRMAHLGLPVWAVWPIVPRALLKRSTRHLMAAWVKFGGGQALWDELSADYGVKSLAVGATGVQMGGWFNKEIITKEDFEGLTMRMPGLGAQVISRMGANAVVLPGGDIVEALFEGTIDATEWVGPYNDLQFGFQKLLSTYIYPGFHEPGTTASVGMNLDFWNNLSDVDRALIETVTDAELTNHTADYYGNNGLALVQLLAESGVNPTRLPDDVWNELARVSFEVTASVADDMGRRIVESYDSYRALVENAGPVSQAEFLAKRGAEDLFSEV